MTDAKPSRCLGNYGTCDAIAAAYVYLHTDFRFGAILGTKAQPHIDRAPEGGRCIDCAIGELELMAENHTPRIKQPRPATPGGA